jgi:hypothetical protein
MGGVIELPVELEDSDAMKSLDERSHSFVVRMWEERREDPEAEPLWRGTVEDVRSGIRVGFVDLMQLCEFLRQRCRGDDSGKP